MINILTDKCAHRDLGVFLETLNDALNLYRVSYWWKPGGGNWKSKSETKGTLGAHFPTEGHSTTKSVAAAFFAQHVEESDLRGWVSDSDSNSSDDELGRGLVC